MTNLTTNTLNDAREVLAGRKFKPGGTPLPPMGQQADVAQALALIDIGESLRKIVGILEKS